MGKPGTSSSPGWWQTAVLAALCSGVIALYALLAGSRVSELGNPTAKEAYYNLLVDGLRSGQLNLARAAPDGLTALADPYDPQANLAFRGYIYEGGNRLHDLTYYRGKLYLYFGITPALLLFWPYAAVTGHYLEHSQAVTIFVSVGFLAGAWLLWSIRRRYFPQIPVLAVAAAAAALGLASGIPVMLSRPDVWEVPISCGYALVMLTLAALWRVLHEARHRTWTLAGASLAYGLAVGARPSLLFGSVILLVPVWLAWSQRRETGDWRRLLSAAVLPLGAVGLGLATYNYLRFGSPGEFGQTFQLAGDRQDINHFGLGYLWFNLRAYFFALPRWSGSFPFLLPPDPAALPPGHGEVDHPFALLTHAPIALFALAAPLAWRSRSEPAGHGLRAFLVAAGGLFLSSALVIGLFYCASARYEIEFTPVLFLLAAAGGFALDHALAGRPAGRVVFRAAAAILLLASFAGNFLAAAEYRGTTDYRRGQALLYYQRLDEAVPVLEAALKLQPANTPLRMDLTAALVLSGRSDAASTQLAEALRRDPAKAPWIHENYGAVFLQNRRDRDLEVLLQAAVAARPLSPQLHYEYGVVLGRLGREQDATMHLLEALRLQPENPSILTALGLLAQRFQHPAAARSYLERALRAEPGNATIRDLLQRLDATSPPPFLQR